MQHHFENIVKEKSDEELLVIVYQFDLWDTGMLKTVGDELRTRGILPGDVAARRQQMVEDEDEKLLNGTAASIGGQIFGWLGVLGLFGLIIGYNYSFSKVRSRFTGKQYYQYDHDSRDNGKYIFYTSLIACSIEILYTFYSIFLSKYSV